MGSLRSLPVAVVAGVVAGIAIIGVMEISVRYVPETSPWDSTIGIVLKSLSPLIPGLIAGFVAARSGFAVGAIASVVTSALGNAYVRLIDTRSIMEGLPEPTIPDPVTYAMVALFVGGVCGIAGAAIAREGRNAF